MNWNSKTGWLAALVVIAITGGSFVWYRNTQYYGSIARVMPVDADDDPDDEVVIFYEQPRPFRFGGIELLGGEKSKVRAVEIPGASPVWTTTVRRMEFVFVKDSIEHRGGNLVVSHSNPKPGLAAFGAHDGRLLWRHRVDVPNVRPGRSSASWAYRRGDILVLSKYEKSGDGGYVSWVEARDASTGDLRWRTDRWRYGLTPPVQFTSERVVANRGGNAIAVELDDGTVRTFGAVDRAIALDERLLIVRHSEEGARREVHVVPDGFNEASPVKVDGEMVEVPPGGAGDVLGASADRLLYFSGDETKGYFDYTTLTAVALRDGVDGYDIEFTAGFKHFWSMRSREVVRDAPQFSPYRRIRSRYILVPVRQYREETEMHRLVVLDTRTGEVQWRSKSYRLPGRDGRWYHEKYRIGYANGDLVALIPAMWRDSGYALIAIDGETARIAGAGTLEDSDLEDWFYSNTVSEGRVYGARGGSPWVIDYREMEVVHGPTVQFTDVTEKFVDAVGPLPSEESAAKSDF